MSATLEHVAMTKHAAKTHASLARALGRHDLADIFEPPLCEQTRDRAEHDVRTAIEDAARILSPADAARIASEAIAEILRGRT
jgi:hypothetical protein